MQDLTLINADDELALHTPDARMRRDPMDEMSSGASTLPRAKSTSARQSKAAQHASPTRHQQQLHVEKHGVVHKCMNTHKLCLQLADWPRAWRRRLPLFNFRAGLGLLRPSGVMWFKALQGGKEGWLREAVQRGSSQGENMWSQWEGRLGRRSLCVSLHCRLANCVGTSCELNTERHWNNEVTGPSGAF